MDYHIEEPILLTKENDFLGTLEKAESIANFIKNNERLLNFNNMIALYGEWGSGKSSILKTIEYKLSNDKCQTVWIDMWKEESDYTNLSIKILSRILSTLNINTEVKRDLLKIFCTIGKGIRINAGIISYDMSSAFEQLDKELEDTKKIDKFISNFQKQIDKYYEDTGKKIIVFLDDLDRCSNDNMLNIIYNIKLLLSVKNIVFLFGIDKNAVTLALKNKYNNEDNKAESFLEKIFPVSFNVPSEIVYNQNIDKIIGEISEKLKPKAHDNIKSFFDKMKFTNPRRIIKILNKYKILEKELEQRKFLNKENEWNIILVLFLIMEHEYNIENYVEMLRDNKKHLLSNLITLNLEGISLPSGFFRKNIGYEEYRIALRVIEIEDNKENERYVSIDLYEYFSNPRDLIKGKIQVMEFYTPNCAKIKFEVWMESFKDSISKRFCYILKENWRQIIDCFKKDGEEMSYQETIKKVKELVYQIDLLL